MVNNGLQINCLGINHQTASVALRERLAYTSNRLETSLARLGCGVDTSWNDIQELVILSTCNRVELYAVGSQPLFNVLEKFLSITQNMPTIEFSSSLYRLSGDETVQHLFQVSAGLDSIVLGEPQILGQVTEAYAVAQRQGTAGKILSRLFQTAIRAGKRARTETSIGHNPASISSVAINLISKTIQHLPTAEIMVLGAGEMAELAVEALRKRGARHILVVNRTLERAQELARRWEGQATALEMLEEFLPEMDIVITSTGAPHTLIQFAMVEKAMQKRPHRPIVIMDIAVPRNVDVNVKYIPSVHIYDMDALAVYLETSLAKREAEIPKVEAILSEEQHEFAAYLATLDVVPIIVEMRKQANRIRQSELEKAIRQMPDLTPEAQQHIEELTRSIVQKLLHSPTVRLRQEANGPKASDYASITRGLFGLD